MKIAVRCVITGDVVDSLHLPRKHLEELMAKVSDITTGRVGYTPSSPPKAGVLPSEWSTVFRGDSFQMVCHVVEGLEHLILLRLFFKSYSLHWPDNQLSSDARLSMAVSLQNENDKEAYEQAFIVSGRGLNTATATKMLISAYNDSQLEDELHAYGVLLDAIISPLTPKQARNLLYWLSIGSITDTAQVLDVSNSTISRSIQGIGYPVMVAIARYRRLIASKI